MYIIVFSILGIAGFLYIVGFFFIQNYVAYFERQVIYIFLGKANKIPAIIEVMRPYVSDIHAFEAITRLHSEVMIYRHDTIYDLMEYYARIHNEFLFLLKLSLQIPELQKNEYFIYIRDFLIRYDHSISEKFLGYNRAIRAWNYFVFIKNCTIVGFILPGITREEIFL